MKDATQWVEQAPRLAAPFRIGFAYLAMTLIFTLLMVTPAAEAIQSTSSAQAQATANSAGSVRIVESVLNQVSRDQIATAEGAFALSADCRFYLRNGGAIKRIDSIAEYGGSPVSAKIIEGKAVWVVIETQESIQ